ncbi:hypothetical protein [Palleronia abyssalis]|uniref:Uncharacterized protein n=1 Tax=Palleronia abyssalis TaxID=1501240 RepID=A0A2R8BQB8_9RHOB|nr:hypothetical protein [Palleronia abyssalis]SPJ22372.1 hypothetical protein PAA8504_00164 [Palleronia abyssalis]
MARSLTAAFAAVCAVFALEFGGVIEGRLFPVVGPVVLGTGEGQPDGSTMFAATSRKLRGCVFERVEWYLGQRRGARVAVPAMFRDAPQVRGIGSLSWTGLSVRLDEKLVRADSFADVIHHCRLRPWKTRTRFHDPVR